MSHVCTDEMAGGEGTAETELSSQYAGSNDSGQLPSIVPRTCWVCSTYTKKI